jgi:hypothetical protein
MFCNALNFICRIQGDNWPGLLIIKLKGVEGGFGVLEVFGHGLICHLFAIDEKGHDWACCCQSVRNGVQSRPKTRSMVNKENGMDVLSLCEPAGCSRLFHAHAGVNGLRSHRGA